MRRVLIMGRLVLGMVVAVLVVSGADASASGNEEGIIPFDTEHWDFLSAKVTEFQGRECLMGFALLKDVEFGDGVLEVDMAVTEARSYAGFVFRISGRGNYEHFYVRAHREGLYGDDLQYAPVTNGISSWQLYSGAGFSAAWDPPDNEWFNVRLEVKGSQARVFINGEEVPRLEIDHLQHGVSQGRVGVQGQMNGSAYFSNFRFTPGDDLVFDEPEPMDPTPGLVRDWKISQVFRVLDLNIDTKFDEKELGIAWSNISTDETGLVDVAKKYSRTGREPDVIFARTTIRSDRKERREYKFGYSDYIAVFLNGDLLFNGLSGYRQRDPSFVGIVGLFDGVYLPLKKGKNDLVVMIAESFGGWGFIAQDAMAEFLAEEVSRGWKVEKGLRMPESVVYDRKRKSIYVSNFDQFNFRNPAISQFITRLDIDGSIRELKWVDGLVNPTGMILSGGSLFVVERTGVTEIDPDTGEVLGRNLIPGVIFLNDIAIDDKGNQYVSDTEKNVIFRYDGEKWEQWMTAPAIDNPNALLFHDGLLYVGNNGKKELLAVELKNGKSKVAARLGEGIIDGIQVEKNGSLLVSHWEGKLFRVRPGGEIKLLFDTRTLQQNTADFGFIPEKNMVLIPTFRDSKVVSYKLD
ncbi:MAG: DUF1080 domain-containing protein [Bacteroidales bacterium]|nr:DUF1080 domain-containing protein [Candidatus Latescibacterota bacterium]